MFGSLKTTLLVLFKNTEREFPPRRPWWKWLQLILSYSLLILATTVAFDQLALAGEVTLRIFGLQRNISYAYISLILAASCIVYIEMLRYKISSHIERLEDPSVVYASLNEARNIEPACEDDKDRRPKGYDQKCDFVRNKISEIEELTEYGWTEHRLLSLNVLLIDFYNTEELKAWSHTLLNELEEYADYSTYRYDREYYGKWENTVSKAIEDIDRSSENNEVNRYDSANELRAVVGALLEHVASYKALWAEGSMLIRNIVLASAWVIPYLLIIGVAPIVFDPENGILHFLNWGILGTVGSLTAVLLALKKTDVVEVGNTEGKRELLRTIIGAPLGLVAGILTYAILAGGIILSGHAVPVVIRVPSELGSEGSYDVLRDGTLSVLWALAAGFSFERVFERMRGVADVGS